MVKIFFFLSFKYDETRLTRYKSNFVSISFQNIDTNTTLYRIKNSRHENNINMNYGVNFVQISFRFVTYFYVVYN